MNTGKIVLGIAIGVALFLIVLLIKDCKGKNLKEDNTLLLNM